MKIANDLVIFEVVIKQNLRAFQDISGAINRWGKTRAVIYSTDRETRLVRGIYCINEGNTETTREQG